MVITKNSYGVTSVFNSNKSYTKVQVGELKGSSLDRTKEQTEEAFIKRTLERSLFPDKQKQKERKLTSMSRRTKSKVRKKVIAFSRVHKKLSLLTLTFVNKVEEETAVKILHRFLDNVSKSSKDFQYIWVAEKQTENKVFKDNIHFHLITNKYWKRDAWRKYWIELQAKHGIVPRDEKFQLTFSLDVRKVDTNNVKALGSYLTAYVTKNQGQFKCQIWNCSKKISRLYTDMYDDVSFLRKVEVLERKGLLGGERKIYTQEYSAVHTIPLNKTTMNFYNRIDEKNRTGWNQILSQEVKHAI
jgi:hypothetical protein